MQFDETKHPRDEKGQFTKGVTLNKLFKKTGETTILYPENKDDTYKGRDNYAQNISHYELIKEAKDEYKKSKTVKIDLGSDIQKKFDNAGPKERTKIAREYILNNLRGVYPAKNGVDINISRKTAKEITNSKYEPKIRVSPELGRLISVSDFIETKKATHKKFNRFIYYKTFVEIGNNKYSAILNVGVDKKNDCVLYDINQFNEK